MLGILVMADISADNTVMENKRRKHMEKFINNAPFALVLVFLVIGFVLLIKGADFFVEGSSSVAKRLHVPSIIIGLTIVAMGTSLPETAVSVSASLTGNNELAVSNVVGSNIFNLMVVIGVCAMIATVNVAKETIKRDIPFSLICAGLLLFLGIAGFGDKAGMILGHLDGVIFLGAFAGYISYMIKVALKASKEGRKVEIEGASEEEIRLISVPLSILFIIGGAAAIAVGGDITVDAASRIASDLGMSQTLIGLTIVSIGTSLPELVTSIVAARKNEVDMALGNAIGSNVFNILMVLGIASAISPVSLITENIIDLCVLIVFTVCVWIFAGTKKKIGKIEGFAMVALYAIYAVYIVIRYRRYQKMILFFKIFFTEFIAEMGDKTQLMLIALTSKHKLKDIILGTAAAILVLNGLAVLAGGLVSEFIPDWLIKTAAALAFLYFAASTIAGDEDDEEGGKSKIKFAPLAVFCTFFLAELGDKTQLTAITFGANEGMGAAFVVWIACSLGLFAADILGMLVGYLLKSKTPDGLLNTIAFIIFSVFGVYTLYQALKLISAGVCPIPVWPVLMVVTIVFVALCGCFFVKKKKKIK